MERNRWSNLQLGANAASRTTATRKNGESFNGSSKKSREQHTQGIEEESAKQQKRVHTTNKHAPRHQGPAKAASSLLETSSLAEDSSSAEGYYRDEEGTESDQNSAPSDMDFAEALRTHGHNAPRKLEINLDMTSAEHHHHHHRHHMPIVIKKWPVKFTDDEQQDRLIPNKCWTNYWSKDCSGSDALHFSAASHRFHSPVLQDTSGLAWTEVIVLGSIACAICLGIGFGGSRWFLEKRNSDRPSRQ